MLIKRISIYPNNSGWAISETHSVMTDYLKKLEIKFCFSRFDIKTKYRYLNMRYQLNKSRQFLVPVTPWQKYYIDYFHGGLYGEKEYEENLTSIVKTQKKIKGIRVIADIYNKLLISKNVDPKLIFKIPLSVNTDVYYPIENIESEKIKIKLGIPKDSHLIGSFQKDGTGWGKGLEPKLIKGPDIFFKTLNILKKDIHNLFVILTGPSRGYIKEKLRENNIQYRHFNADDIIFRSKLYNILNGYLITSREEGGPNSFLESMACCVPVVTTKVGHTSDIGDPGKDCFIVNSFNPQDIADEYLKMINTKDLNLLRNNMRQKALLNSNGQNLNLWRNFFSIN
tara:strand:- start:269 stop:1285 length:1017 start_codon:yes stop_codon:yes gene_type:complete